MARLFAGALAALHVDDATYRPGPDGWVEVAPEHVDAALSHGARREPPKAAAAPAAAEERLADIEARLAALEAAWNSSKLSRRSAGSATG